MSRWTIPIWNDRDRERAANWAMRASIGMRVEFKEAKRSLDQNSKLWASLTDVSSQVVWHGHRLTPTEWKFVFLDALKRESRTVPSIDGTGMVDIGRSSSDLSKSEMSDLIEIIMAFGVQHGVVFHDQQEVAA